MSGKASRPIVRELTDTGVIYVPIARERQLITISIAAGGLTGIEVAYTGDNIIRVPTSSYDVNDGPARLQLPAAAQWTVLQANAISTAVVGVTLQAFALRLTGTGTGTARIVILQSEE